MRSRAIAAIVATVLAVAGTAVLVVHVQGLQARVEADERPVQVLVVREPVAEGTVGQDLGDAVEVIEMPARFAAEGSVASLDQVAGQVATADLVPGEQVVAGRFADPATIAADEVPVPEGFHRLTIALPAERALGGQLRPGDTVGVFVSVDDEPVTRLLLHKVLVTDVQVSGQAPAADVEDQRQPVPTGAVLVTLALDAGSAERVVFAAEHATVWLSSEPPEAAEASTGGRTRETIYD